MKLAIRSRLITWIITFGLLLISTVAVRAWYDHNLSPLSSVKTTTYFTVSLGSSVHQIATHLQDNHLIRSSQAFQTYVASHRYGTKLQAGTYNISPSMSVKTIVQKMVSGDVSHDLVTILPGQRLDQIKKAFIKAGYGIDEVDQAFDPANYTGEPNLDSFLPDEVTINKSLEGFLYPDTFQKTADTSAKAIIGESLDEMRTYLTQDIINGFRAQGLSVYQGVTLTSIVYQETGDPAGQSTVAQVFLTRLKQGMALQSNVTADYAADLAGVTRDVSISSPYNTYLHTGLPPGPISNVTSSALEAVAHPSNTTYLYFIAGDDGKMYFSRTAQEHQAAIDQHCQKACAH